MCPWGTHFCEWVNAYKNIYITRDDDDADVRPTDRVLSGGALAWVVGKNDIYFLSLENVKLIN